MQSREIINRLTADGWRKVAQKGSHVQFKHPTKPGRVTVPHPKRDIPTGTLRSIEKQCGPQADEVTMRYYIALLHKDPKSDYGVSFPDLPGCITAGRTLDEARAMAVDALALHLQGMIEDGSAIPEPSSLETVMADPDNRDGVVTPDPGPVDGRPRRPRQCDLAGEPVDRNRSPRRESWAYALWLPR